MSCIHIHKIIGNLMSCMHIHEIISNLMSCMHIHGPNKTVPQLVQLQLNSHTLVEKLCETKS